MLVDFHAHSSGISTCCKASAREVIEEARAVQINGLILTNHYKKKYQPDGNFPALAERYIAEYHSACEIGNELGVKIFFGIEVTMLYDEGLHMLIYGVEEDFLRRNPRLFELSIPELSRLVHSAGGALVQAHPMRGNSGERIQDPKYIDAYELSCHPIYEGTHIDTVSVLAREGGILLTVGADYHADTPRVRCGVRLDDKITSRGIADFLRQANEVNLLITEVGTDTPYEYNFIRKC